MSTIFVLFLWINGQAEPYMAFSDSEFCWGYVAVIEADGIDAECRTASIATQVGAPLRTSPRPLPKPEGLGQ